MSNCVQVTPFMHVLSIDAAATFFEDILGFETLYREPRYAYVEREGCGMRMLQRDEEDGPPAGCRRFAYYPTSAMSMRCTPS